MHTTHLELHILQSFPPCNLNRDENGMPKSCVFGGRPRARISSQCQKRAVRLYYQERATELDLNPSHFADRSRRWLPELKQMLLDREIAAEQAELAAQSALTVMGVKFKDNLASDTTLFLGRTEITEIANILVNNWPAIESTLTGKKPTLPKDIEKAVSKAVDPNQKPGDVALFGRMMASLPSANVDASVQVAHAIGINQLQQDFDFFTAVDDLGGREETGSDHMGEIGYNSSTYYRFAVLNTQQLIANLGSTDSAAAMASAFATAFIKAIPSGYQNSFAAHSLPALVLAVVRNGQPVSLVDAYEKPIRPTGKNSLLEHAVEKLTQHWENLTQLYGASDVAYLGIATRAPLVEKLNGLGQHAIPAMDDLVTQAVDAAFSGNATQGDA